MKVYVVLDDRDRPVTVFDSRERADAYVDREFAEFPDWQREMYGWTVMELEMNEEPKL